MPDIRPSRRELVVLAALLGTAGATLAVVRSTRPVGRRLEPSAALNAMRADRDSPSTGAAYGDVALLVFTDFNCPACRRAHPDMIDAVEADGNVRLIFRDWPVFGRPSTDAARIAIASHSQGLTRPVRAALMRGGRADAASATAAVAAAGGDLARLSETMRGDAGAIDTLLHRTRRDAFTLGLRGTPSHLIGPILAEGALGQRDFERALARAREPA